MVSRPGSTSWTPQARRSSVPCGSSTCALATASCWCLLLMTGRVSTRWASFSRRSSESRTETISPSCWLGTRLIWRHSARSPDLKPLPLAPPTTWPTSRPQPNCASMWTRPLSSWCGLSGSTRSRSSRPAHPVPPGRKTEAVPASSSSPGAKGAASMSSRDQLPSLSSFPFWVSQDTLHPHPKFLAFSRTSPLCAFCRSLPSPPKPLGEGLPGFWVTAVYNSPLYPQGNKRHCQCQKVLLEKGKVAPGWWVDWVQTRKASLHLCP